MAPDGILNHTFALILIVIGLLSGVLSVVREFQLMYYPPKTNKRRTLWGWVRIAFVIAAVILWLDEHSKVTQLVTEVASAKSEKQKAEDRFKELTVPDLHGKIVSTWVAPSGDQEQNVLLTIVADITNTGAQSIAELGKVEVVQGSRSYSIQPLLCPPKPLVLFSGSRFSSPSIEFYPSECLPSISVSHAIPNGGKISGFLQMIVEGISNTELNQANTAIRLHFTDVTGKAYATADFFLGKNSKWSPNLSTLQPKHHKK